MMRKPKIPETADDWAQIYQEVLSDPHVDSFESGVLNSIFGEAYLKQTIDLLIAHGGFRQADLHEPIEKFLRAVSSAGIRRYLIELCFHSTNHDALSTACGLLPALSNNIDLLPHLPAFASSDRPALWRCGVAITLNLAFTYLSSAEIKEAADLFRSLDDQYVADKVKELDRLAIRAQELDMGPRRGSETESH